MTGTENRIDLDQYRSGGSRIFTGRERGRAVRREAHLDRRDQGERAIEVHVPDDVYSVNSSFFLGMFEESIKRLGAEKFRSHYRFTGRDISRTIQDAVRAALSSGSPI